GRTALLRGRLRPRFAPRRLRRLRGHERITEAALRPPPSRTRRAARTPPPVTDLLIRGGTVIDGSGAPATRGDVAITGNRIPDVGQLIGRRALRMIDGRGTVVAPG